MSGIRVGAALRAACDVGGLVGLISLAACAGTQGAEGPGGGEGSGGASDDTGGDGLSPGTLYALRQPCPAGLGPALGLDFFEGGAGWLACADDPDDYVHEAPVFATADQGQTWVESSLLGALGTPYHGVFFGFHETLAGAVMACGAAYQGAETAEHGRPVESPLLLEGGTVEALPGADACYTVAEDRQGRLVLRGSGWGGGVKVSADGGATWEVVEGEAVDIDQSELREDDDVGRFGMAPIVLARVEGEIKGLTREGVDGVWAWHQLEGEGDDWWRLRLVPAFLADEGQGLTLDVGAIGGRTWIAAGILSGDDASFVPWASLSTDGGETFEELTLPTISSEDVGVAFDQAAVTPDGRGILLSHTHAPEGEVVLDVLVSPDAGSTWSYHRFEGEEGKEGAALAALGNRYWINTSDALYEARFR